MADPKAVVDLKMLKKGDPVNVKSDSNGVIKSFKAAESATTSRDGGMRTAPGRGRATSAGGR